MGGVAWFAHIGGFVVGLILALPWVGRARQMNVGGWYR
jgi:membrane associated rhomboid family serine protease